MAKKSISNEEQIGFHKGSLATLVKERQELAKMVGVVDQLIGAHVKALENLGVKLQTEKKADNPDEQDKELDDKLEDLLTSD